MVYLATVPTLRRRLVTLTSLARGIALWITGRLGPPVQSPATTVPSRARDTRFPDPQETVDYHAAATTAPVHACIQRLWYMGIHHMCRHRTAPDNRALRVAPTDNGPRGRPARPQTTAGGRQAEPSMLRNLFCTFAQNMTESFGMKHAALTREMSSKTAMFRRGWTSTQIQQQAARAHVATIVPRRSIERTTTPSTVAHSATRRCPSSKLFFVNTFLALTASGLTGVLGRPVLPRAEPWMIPFCRQGQERRRQSPLSRATKPRSSNRARCHLARASAYGEIGASRIVAKLVAAVKSGGHVRKSSKKSMVVHAMATTPKVRSPATLKSATTTAHGAIGARGASAPKVAAVEVITEVVTLHSISLVLARPVLICQPCKQWTANPPSARTSAPMKITKSGDHSLLAMPRAETASRPPRGL